ncbi:hypothetical protein M9Y10_038501 [Tritrichomonas musculus]|uniref:Protein kinase domain-containing protein n=1 Tax=Tritrichomonas musculus TaxID=1915356 RepID=A0ABR2K8L2_9EUKA
MHNILDFGIPYWDETTPLPSENEEIHKYFIRSMLHSTKSSFYYVCLDKDEKQVKIIKFIKLLEEKIPRIKDEIETINIVQHSNIIKVEDCFRYTAYICVVFPYTPHLTIHHYLMNKFPTGFPENIASSIFLQMLKGVEYLHSQNIWNRDIKLESFLIFDNKDQKDPNNNLNILLSNFEYAKIFEKDTKGTQFIGTPEYMAPEMANHVPYNESVDIWSLGISLFVMLTGQSPFPDYKTQPQSCLNHVKKGFLNYQLLANKGISQSAVLLIENMCDVDPKKRPSATEALKNTWITDNTIYMNTNEVVDESKIADEFFEKNKDYLVDTSPKKKLDDELSPRILAQIFDDPKTQADEK